MKYVMIVLRTLLGLMFVVFGLEHFVKFMNMPKPDWPDEAFQFAGVMGSTGYMNVVKVLEIVGGAMLVTGFFVPLGLTLLGPVIVNITLFHIFLAKEVNAMTFIPAALFLIVFGFYWSSFRGVFAAAPPYCCSGKRDGVV